MNGKTELFAYLGAAIATTVALFALQAIYVSYIDVFVVNAPLETRAQDAKVVARRAEEAQKLSGGSMPLARASEMLAQRGRAASNKIAPAPSTDLSAMSGWIHRHGFAPYVPKAAPAPTVTPAPVEGAAVPVEGAPAPAAAPKAATPAPASAAPAGAH